MSDSEDNDAGQQKDYVIKPEKGVASIDTSDWPLLLKVSFLIKSGLAKGISAAYKRLD